MAVSPENHSSLDETASGDSGAEGAERIAEAQRSVTFPCESCGADLQFSVGGQSLKCEFCGFVKELEFGADAEVAEQDFAAMLERLAEQRPTDQGDEPALSEVRCTSCGATVCFAGTLTSSECSYCGVSLQRQNVHDAANRVAVDGVLPFMIDRRQAQSNLRSWIQSRWFAPKAFKKRGVEGGFSGVYLPYWTFDAATATRYSGERGEHYWVTTGSGSNKRRVRRTRWYPASGSFQHFFNDILIRAATGIPAKRIEALAPWPLQRCRPFNQQLLAGFLARTYDTPLDAGFGEARLHIDQSLEAEVGQRIGGDAQRISSIETRYNAITYKHLLLPVWIMAYRYGGRSYQVVINAGTGEVQGDRPYSMAKIIGAVLGGLIGAAILAFIFLSGGS